MILWIFTVSRSNYQDYINKGWFCTKFYKSRRFSCGYSVTKSGQPSCNFINHTFSYGDICVPHISQERSPWGRRRLARDVSWGSTGFDMSAGSRDVWRHADPNLLLFTRHREQTHALCRWISCGCCNCLLKFDWFNWYVRSASPVRELTEIRADERLLGLRCSVLVSGSATWKVLMYLSKLTSQL